MVNKGGRGENKSEKQKVQLAYARDSKRLKQQDKVAALDAQVTRLKAGGDEVMEDLSHGDTEAEPKETAQDDEALPNDGAEQANGVGAEQAGGSGVATRRSKRAREAFTITNTINEEAAVAPAAPLPVPPANEVETGALTAVVPDTQGSIDPSLGVVTRTRSAALFPAPVHLDAVEQAAEDELPEEKVAREAEEVAHKAAVAARKAVDAERYAHAARVRDQKQANIDRYGPLWPCKQELIESMQRRTPGPPRLSGTLFCMWMKFLLLLFAGLLTHVAPLDFNFTSLADNPNDKEAKRSHDGILAGIFSFVEAKDNPTAALFLVRELRSDLRKDFIRKMIQENATVCKHLFQEADMAEYL